MTDARQGTPAVKIYSGAPINISCTNDICDIPRLQDGKNTPKNKKYFLL